MWPFKKKKRDEGCTCQKCGNKFRIDLYVSDWERIKPQGAKQGAGLMCGSCIFKEMERIADKEQKFYAYKLEAEELDRIF